MKSTTIFTGRRTAPIWLGASVGLLLTGVLVAPVGAADMDKSQFKKGCESGGGSYIENNDDSFQCNLKSGGTIKCADTKNPCTYTAQISRALISHAVKTGKLKIER